MANQKISKTVKNSDVSSMLIDHDGTPEIKIMTHYGLEKTRTKEKAAIANYSDPYDRQTTYPPSKTKGMIYENSGLRKTE